jgi:mono/diheme cytochrome c family protein
MNRIIHYACIVLNVFLVFITVFEKKLVLPKLLAFSGQFHPVMLHFPIGIIGVLLLGLLFMPTLLTDPLKKALAMFLSVTAVITAIFGLFLGHEGYEAGQIAWHKYTGVGFSVACLLYYLYQEYFNAHQLFGKVSAASIMLLATVAGHQGGSITHGEDFLSYQKGDATGADGAKAEAKTVFDAAVMPIFEKKCVQCHNNSKTKGSLNMTTVALLLKGGKHGSLWKAGDPANSFFLQRSLLPLEHEEHMPPKGKEQLTPAEIELLSAWVKEGAKTNEAIASVKNTSYFYGKLQTGAAKEAKVYSFSDVSEGDLEKIRTPFLSVEKIATESPAVKAGFFVSSVFKTDDIKKLDGVKEQLISLSLAKMPVDDKVIGDVTDFENLESLFLNDTKITGSSLTKLHSLKNLEHLSLSNTAVTLANLKSYLKEAPAKQTIYLWSTAIKPEDVKGFKQKFEFGFIPSATEKLKLVTPQLVNQSMVLPANGVLEFKHTVPGVTFRYAMNNDKIDSTSKPFSGRLFVKDFAKIKVLVTKDGWRTSDSLVYQFYTSKVPVQKVITVSGPVNGFLGRGEDNLINHQFAISTNKSDPNWEGYRETPFEKIFVFNKPQSIKESIIASNNYNNDMIFPPGKIEVYVSVNKGPFELVTTQVPKQTTVREWSATRTNYFLPINKTNVTSVKIKATNAGKIPAWHFEDKRKETYFILDEVLFN